MKLSDKALDAISAVLAVALDGKIASEDLPEIDYKDLERAQKWVHAEKAQRRVTNTIRGPR